MGAKLQKTECVAFSAAHIRNNKSIFNLKVDQYYPVSGEMIKPG